MLCNSADTYQHNAKCNRKIFLPTFFCLIASFEFALATQDINQTPTSPTNNANNDNAMWQQTQDSTNQNLSNTLPNTTLQDATPTNENKQNQANNDTPQQKDSQNSTDNTETEEQNSNKNPQQDSQNKEAQKITLESATKHHIIKRGFIGLEASYAGIKYDEKGTLGSNAISVAPRAESSGGGLRVGILGGYRHFFTQGIGVRGYVNIDYFESQAPANLSVGTIQAIHYGINADFLMNFKEIGVFFGLGVGGVNYFGSGVNRLKSEAKSSNSGFGVSQNGVETGLQIGLQSLVCKSIGIELVAKIPFVPHYFINKGSEANIISRQITQSYTVGARILYHF